MPTTTPQQQKANPMLDALPLAALLRDLSIVLAAVVYTVHTLN